MLHKETKMDQATVNILQIFVGAFVSLIPSLIIAYYGYRQFNKSHDLNVKTQPVKNKVTEGEAVEKFALGYDKLVEDLQSRIDRLEDKQSKLEVKIEVQDKKIDDQNKRITYLETGVRQLVKQVKDLGGDPVFDINGSTK